MSLSVVMPALNEEQNLGLAVSAALRAFEDFGITGEVLVINDGSRDNTRVLAEQFSARDGRVRVLNHDSPKGIGASFWDGVDNARGEVVIMLPGDNENDPWEIFRYYRLLDHVDIVIPFIYNKQVRSLFRNAVSFLYRFIINTTFLVYFNYTNGTIMYRRSALLQLEQRNSGFFFQTDILIRLVKRGYLFAEVPYRLGMRRDGVSKAVSFPSLVQVAKGYFRLVKAHYFTKQARSPQEFSGDSVTRARRER